MKSASVASLHWLSPHEKRALEEFIRLASKQKGVLKIILFGSRARGEGGKDSDLDLLVITEGEECEPILRLAYEAMMRSDFHAVLSPIPLSLDEWKRLEEMRASFWENVCTEGITLWRR